VSLLGRLRPLAAHLREHGTEAALALACMLVLVGATLLVPPWGASLLRDAIPSGDMRRLLWSLALGLGLAVAISLASFGRDYLLTRIALRFAADMRDRMVARVLRRPLAAFASGGSGEQLARVAQDTAVLQQSLVRGLAIFVPNVLVAVGLLGYMVRVSWVLSLGAVVLALPMLWLVAFFGRRLHGTVHASQRRAASMSAALGEALDGARDAKAFGREAALEERIRRLGADALAASLREERMIALHPAAVLLIGVIGLAGLVAISAYFRQRGLLSGADLVAFLVALGLAVGPLQEAARSGGIVARFLAVLERCTEVLEAPVEDDPPGMPRLPRLAGRITLEAVCVDYATTGFRLGELTLAIAAGETVAVVGPSGAGKSTLLDVIARFIEPTSGRLVVDTFGATAYRRDSLREQIGIVTQHPFLFEGTIAENIRFGRPDAGDDAVRAATRAAHVDEFVARLPHGLATRLDARGANLSVGQRQRIALARALLRDPAILLLDEPTSALDAESEQLLQDALRRTCAGKTMVIVTHRPALLAMADRVVVLERGRIVADRADRLTTAHLAEPAEA
jgi:ABC-type multidrug transport system fused ATPase/permease subunit